MAAVFSLTVKTVRPVLISGLAMLLAPVTTPVLAFPWLVPEVVEHHNGGPAPFDIPPFFPDHPWVAERSGDLFHGLRTFNGAQNEVRASAIHDTIVFGLRGWTDRPWDFDVEQGYRAAIAMNDCSRAYRIVWDTIVANLPYLTTFRDDDGFGEYLRWDVLSGELSTVVPQGVYDGAFYDHRYLAACLAAQDARFFHALIEQWALDAGTQEIVRPFIDYPNLVAASVSVHAARDGNFWHLIHMATRGRNGGYGPAAVLLVELALELDSLNLANDILTMLLLRAEETWPADDRPLPVAREHIAELLDQIRPRLSENELVRAQRCYMTNELYDRLFLGDASYFEAPEEDQCQVDVGSAD